MNASYAAKKFFLACEGFLLCIAKPLLPLRLRRRVLCTNLRVWGGDGGGRSGWTHPPRCCYGGGKGVGPRLRGVAGEYRGGRGWVGAPRGPRAPLARAALAPVASVVAVVVAPVKNGDTVVTTPRTSGRASPHYRTAALVLLRHRDGPTHVGNQRRGQGPGICLHATGCCCSYAVLGRVPPPPLPHPCPPRLSAPGSSTPRAGATVSPCPVSRHARPKGATRRRIRVVFLGAEERQGGPG